MQPQKIDIFQEALRCIDATLRSETQACAETSDESLYCRVDTLLQDFRQKYEITETDLGNAEAWEYNTFGSQMEKDSDKLAADILLAVWDHIYELMADCGVGEVTREVFANQILQTPLSWDVKEKAVKDYKAKKALK